MGKLHLSGSELLVISKNSRKLLKQNLELGYLILSLSFFSN
jgi:hypothetical protein